MYRPSLALLCLTVAQLYGNGCDVLANTDSSSSSASTASLFASPSKTTTGHANCISGTISVSVSVNNTKFTLPVPKDQPTVTQFLVDILGVDANNYINSVTSGSQIIKGTYKIYGRLCIPSDPTLAKNVKTLQILSHGDTLSSNYWDLPNQSYVDYMASQGYATLAYDRLGIGLSDHPDGIQVVQYPIHVAILHELVQMIRSLKYNDVPVVKNIVGVGHSAGSTATSDLTSKYPKDFDAVILQGISAVQTFIGITDAALLLSVPAKDERNGQNLPNSYLTPAIAEGIQFSFYSYPNYDQNIFAQQVATKQTNTVGELMTYNNIVAVSESYTGPVDCVLGQNDNIFCGDDCNAGGDQAAIFIQQYYPKASKGSQHYIAAGSGHVINCHYSAPQSWVHNVNFLKANNL